MDYEKITSEITSLYDTQFNSAYSALGSGPKTDILRYSFSFYKKWQSSPLITNNYLLTPTTVFSLINRYFDTGKLTIRVPRLSSFKRFTGFKYHDLTYTLDDHPVVRDLHAFINSCKPSFEFNEDFSLSAEHEAALMKILSLQCPFYIEYLHRISWGLGLLRDMPSIHTNIVQPSNIDLLELPSRKIFEKIVDASISNVHFMLTRFISVPGVLDIRYIQSLLKSPTPCDEVFAHIYTRLGFDFEQIASIDEASTLDSESEDLLSGTFGLGMLLGRYFFTVFGTYLRLINTIYVFPMDMRSDMEYVRSVSGPDGDPFEMEIPFFTPCSLFGPSSLGVEYFILPEEALMESPNTPSLEDALRMVSTLKYGNQAKARGRTIPKLDVSVTALSFSPQTQKSFTFKQAATLDEVAAAVSFEFLGFFTYDYFITSYINKKKNFYIPHHSCTRNMFSYNGARPNEDNDTARTSIIQALLESEGSQTTDKHTITLVISDYKPSEDIDSHPHNIVLEISPM